MKTREDAARREAGLRLLRREAAATAPAFDLAYLRPATGAGPVVLVIAGGPGVAVPLMYREVRTEAVARGLDIVMVEHRGVGLSRTDAAGEDLPVAAVTVPAVVDDLVAVLDAEGIDRAIVSGSSYGSYVAGALAVTAPERLAGLVLDAPLLGAADVHETRAWARSLLWEGARPETAEAARKIRILVERDGHEPLRLGAVASLLHEFGGAPLLERWLDQLVVGRSPLTGRLIRHALQRDVGQVMRHLAETDLVAGIAYGELDYAAEPDGGIFDPSAVLSRSGVPPFRGEHYDLRTQLAAVDVPAVVLVGERDLRTPPPIARLAAQVLPDATLLEVPGHGHSALDSRHGLLLEVLDALAEDRHRELPASASALARRHRPTGSGTVVTRAVRGLLLADRILAPFPRTPRGLA